jgi:hypothetical protein
VHGEGEKKHKVSGKAPNPHEEPHSFEPCEWEWAVVPSEEWGDSLGSNMWCPMHMHGSLTLHKDFWDFLRKEGSSRSGQPTLSAWQVCYTLDDVCVLTERAPGRFTWINDKHTQNKKESFFQILNVELLQQQQLQVLNIWIYI